MKGFERKNKYLSLCGLNCALCPMYVGGYCPACGGGAGNQSCRIAACSIGRKVEYCFECGEYPCARYEGMDDADSFITHKNRRADFERAKTAGTDAYGAEQREKEAILREFLRFDDGRSKSRFCLAVNLLGLDVLREILAETSEAAFSRLSGKEQAAWLTARFRGAAERAGVELRLRKK